MRHLFKVAVPAILLSAQVAMAQTTRELDAHEHGHSSLNIAIEGSSVTMELEAPGADIVGFEYEAETEGDKAKVASAKELLHSPLGLFQIPAAAGCKVTKASVELEREEEHKDHDAHDDDHADGHDDDHAEAHDDDHGEKKGGHTEFHATYTMTCKNPDKIETIGMTFFKKFPNAEEVEVNVVSEKGQRKYEIERDEPRLDLQGLI